MTSKQKLEQLNLEAITETLNLLKGKWRLQIITVLAQREDYRFNDLLQSITGIGSKMLSTDLKCLEQHDIITRTILSASPLIISYSLTDYGKTLHQLLFEMSTWGGNHLKKQIESNTENEINHFLTITI
ncbi:MAG: helix-turn-helix transcriptional regulator [Flavobacteriaceae bacterium]|jgi:DNA-binding HxlR family transcriptional regulator|nr:helix-turn-helix transcriptional regulator [Flavobacteriaceae bacterium]